MKKFIISFFLLHGNAYFTNAQAVFLADSISVYFASNSCYIATTEQNILKQWFSLVGANNKSFAVTGYADRRGSAQYNLQLSRYRANAIAKYITNNFDFIIAGINAYGKNFPVSNNDLQLNRRVVIAISKPITQKLNDRIAPQQLPIRTEPELSVTDTVTIIKQKLQIDSIFFFPDKAVVLPESQIYLEKLSKILMQFPAVDKFEIRGYVNCPVCKTAYDTTSTMYKLSRSRAKEVYLWLISLGVPATRMRYVGMGASNMAFPKPKTEAEMRKNMRVEVVVY